MFGAQANIGHNACANFKCGDSCRAGGLSRRCCWR